MLIRENINEKDRLEDLQSYGILNSPEDERFDKIVRLAAAICKTPVSAVSFIDNHKQWIKSCHGFHGIKEFPRQLSICINTFESNSVMVVPDTLKDHRFQGHPAVTGGPKIRFYAGAPLVSTAGFPLGALCVVDFVPRSMTKEQLEALGVLSEQLVEILELRKSNHELVEARKILKNQQDLLIHKARLQSLGELASGICHQINNPLAIIAGRSMVLRSRLLQNPELDKDLLNELDVIDRTSVRISDVIKALSLYRKDFRNAHTHTSIHEVVESSLLLLKTKFLTQNIDLDYQRNDKDLKIMMNKYQIGQLMLILLENSLEAMENVQEKRLEVLVRERESEIEIVISDSGHGISNEISGKIFDPFFTTKSGHFGVGLFNASTIIDSHNGKITLERSAPASFKITLPKAS